EQDYFPVISAELEFYLYPSDAKADGYTFASQCFDMNAPDDYQALLDEIEHIANLQGIQIVSIVSESAAGQYEINIPHSADVLKICD
ncbi:glutamine synthetase, partial [Pseudomonas aeruginosa]